ncbi:dynein heavy chain, putative [Trypanosoma brucei brucei TREU927]|uniref:Cytoplasmic dynein 2 heavy chain 1 n=1 Tax=Trypanosoma brucei brucei (strain 927/4 GUTat10.1) TaxID=185431 RepID=Q386R7_TRYB2|nr:dynein heavy chain, putative [Trypanosoma brucei brucei TREU927]EAN79214.1 dynein heavy chain, putative [Trypanosoma brucei brucei TREU927]
MERSGPIVVESQLLNVVQRHLRVIFGGGNLTRGDGCILFTAQPIPIGGEEEARLTDDLQRLCLTIVRDMTGGRTSLRLPSESEETNFTLVKKQVLPFDKFLKEVGAVDDFPDNIDEVSDQPNIHLVLETLYNDVVSDLPSGAVMVEKFPKVMCPTGKRLDLVMRKASCVQVYSNLSTPLPMERAKSSRPAGDEEENEDADTNGVSGGAAATKKSSGEPQLKVWVNMRVLASAVASYSATPVEHELPIQWRQKSFALAEAREVLGLVYETLRSYWKRNPHSERNKMDAAVLLSIVSGDLQEYVKGQLLLDGRDWRGIWRMNIDQLEKSVELIAEWGSMKEVLLRGEWKDVDVGSEKGGVQSAFEQRLRDVLRIRQLLASAENLSPGKAPESIAPEVVFDGESVTDRRVTSDDRWKTCIGKFEKEFSFLEDHLRGRVKQLFGSNQRGQEDLIRTLKQHRTLLNREGIKNGVEGDMASVAEHLIKQLQKIQVRYENNKRRSTTDLHTVKMAKSAQTECAQIPEIAGILFGKSTSLDQVVKVAEGIMGEMQKEESEALAAWRQNMENHCKKLTSLPDAVVFNGSNKQCITCTVHPSIKQCLQEIYSMRSWCGRRHEELLRISEEGEGVIKACEKLIKATTRSMQVVSNYNTVQRQIIHCTRSMLESASNHALSQLLYKGSDKRLVTIANYNEIDGLNMRFQNAVDALCVENRRIRRFHVDFMNQVAELHNLELAGQTDQWRTAVDGLRRLFEEFLNAHNIDNYDNWRRHLDAQIYKALEHQYQRGLETMHEKMQEFKVELVFKQGQVQFKPSFEAVREAYYQQVRELVGIPLRFRGLQQKKESGGPYELYKLIPLSNKDRIVTVHLKAVELFGKLNRVRKAFRTHVLVGTCGINGGPDIDALVEATCANLKNYSDGFNVVKEQLNKLRDIDDNMKIDGFTISTIPIKASVEEQLHRLEEALLNAMRKTMQQTLSAIDTFVYNASNVITRQPVTMEEVGQANKAYREFVAAMPSYEEKFSEAEELNRVLRQHTGTVIDIGSTKSRWEHLREAIASHHKVIDASMSKMRVSLDSMIQKHMKDGQRFSSKWDKMKAQLLEAFKESKPALIDTTLTQMKDSYNELDELKTQSKELEAKCLHFKLPPPNFHELETTLNDVSQTATMWTLYDNFRESLDTLRKEDWLTFRSHTYVFEDFMKEWKAKLTATANASHMGSDTDVIAQYLHNMLEGWAICVPMFRFVRGEGMMTEHWNEMFRLLEIEKGMTSTDLTFGHILDHHKQLVAAETELKQLHARVQGEVQIREALQDLRAWALEANFTLIAPADSATPAKVKLISEWKETLAQVSDNQSLIGSLKDSPFFSHFADEANGWEVKLANLYEALMLMNTIQRKWTYLEPIFARGALPQEQARFKRVDKEFVSIMQDVEADPRVMTIASQADIVDRLKTILDQIERCQKSLMEFLESKRESFSRFYFISDEDMLEILGHSKSPSVIQAHLKKLFMGINSVIFSEDHKFITHMVSSDREQVELAKPVSIEEDDVEKWLVALDQCMKETLQRLLASCVKVKNIIDPEPINRYPSQVLQVTLQVQFSAAVEEAISKNSLSALGGELKNVLNKLTMFPADTDPVSKLKVKALILDVIHHIEVVEALVAKGVTSTESWWWQKQLRYYMNENELCYVAMMDTKFDYTYEYQGNAAKLVHTPLTDKCYLVLTKGMQLGYGGNPYGPAGTGKTESVKALGSAMGRQVLVFNCDEGIDFKSMGRIFMGIVKCGAWGCFDEFNRLKIDQLSAISQMIQVIQEAIKNREPSCTLLNRLIQVNKNAGIFVTLNPAGKGYGGRSKLPDNLRQLFREVAMTQPNNELITSTMLLSEGFTHAKNLAKKIVEMYRLSGQLMSKQQHYDWGLRSLKAVLHLAGSLVQKWKADNGGNAASEKQEEELVLQSLSINMLSKLSVDDARLFRELAVDVFPQVSIREIAYGELESAIEVAVRELGLQLVKSQVHKVLQLYEALGQRMGVVLVGPSGSGKSTLLRILRKAMQILKIEVPLHVMNPKAIHRQQLLGYMDPDTREWYDGVLSAAARDVVRQPKESRPWILCDGDIDPEWVESLNSVLDDNKLLTLPNGVRIQFGKNVNFIFETHSLAYASPATVSRMGVILFSEDDVSLEPAVRSFLHKQPEERRELLGPLIEKYLIPAVHQTLRLDALVVPTTGMGILNCCLAHILHVANEEDFVFSLLRGLCGMLHPEGAKTITTAVYEMGKVSPVSKKRPLDTYYDHEKKCLKEFASNLTVDSSSGSLLKGELIVPTVDVQRLMATLEPLVSDTNCRPVFLVGPEGSGKSITLQQCFARHSGVRITVLHCSAQTTSLHLIQKLEQMCTISSTSSGHVYRPKEGERLVIILKNVNLPKPDRYGTVELHAFMMQLIMYQGFYNNDLEWIGIEKVQLVASMNPTVSAGRYAVTPRLLAVVGIVFMSYPSKAGLNQIYTEYFKSLISSVPDLGCDLANCPTLSGFVINVFEKICRKREGEEYAHCLFCPRSITNWVTNVLMYEIDSQTTTLPAVLGHEATCIFADCLPRAEDIKKARKTISESLATIGYSSTSSSSADDANSILFVSWLSEADERGQKRLKGVSYEAAAAEVEQGIVKYSREHKTLNIHVIPEVVGWLARVDRVLTRPFGHLILVGRPGVGRRNAVCLAAFLLKMNVVTLNMMQKYALKNFRQDLRQFIQRATTQNERLVLMLEDHNIVDETFLEMINSLVSSGEVPGLFTQEEVETMCASLREDAANDGYMGSIASFYLQRLRRNLRIALVMDNCHPLFLVRLQSNPGLISNCDLLWMGAWSNDATRNICKKRLAAVIDNIGADSANKGFHLHRELFSVHESFGEEATPERFRVLMENYESILQKKGESGEASLKRLDAGLAKLHEAEESVAKIQSDVKRKKKKVEEKQKEADKALTEIQQKMEESKEQRDTAEELQARLSTEQEEIAVKREKVTKELSGITPMLESAREAVSSIRSEQLNEIRSLKAPPEPVKDVLEAVLALLGVNDVSWQSMRKFLGERGVKERILDFDAKNISTPIRENVARLMNQKAGSFKQETIRRASVAAAPMAAWVKAMIDYSTILESIGPLNKQLEDLETNSAKGQEQLKQLKSKLKKIDEAVAKLRKEFSEKCKDAERIKDTLEKAQKELTKAKDLLEKLSGEKTRWSQDAQKIQSSNQLLPKRALVAAAFITYIARETEDVRQRYLKQWSSRLNLPDVVKLTGYMRTDGELLQWKSEGLPSDDLSQENAIAMLDSVQTPLVIDPSNQAIEWVKMNLKTNNIVSEVTSMHDERFSHTLELAVRFGKTLLVMDVDGVEPILYPILRRDIFTAGAKQVVQVGNKQVDWQDKFRIMLFTRRTDIDLPPGAAALVLVVNFSVTKFGLENQLLGVTIQHERPELEQERAALLQKEESLKLELNKLEERLLSDLANSSGDLLENTALIQALNDVKVQASSITEALEKSHKLEAELNEKREVYRPFASNGSTIFFLVKDLENLNRMYHFGLNDFVRLFVECLSGYKGETDIEAKMAGLATNFIQKCFVHVSRGLLERDRLVFGMHLIHGFFPQKFPSSLWNLLVGASAGSANTEGNAASDGSVQLPIWAPPMSRAKFTALLADATASEHVKKWDLNDEKRWGSWILENTPEESLTKNSGLSFMEQLLIVDTFRPDRLADLAHHVIMHSLQLDSLTPLTSLEEMLTGASATTPIILITSGGADPSQEVQEVAYRRMERQRFTQIALGGGQTDDAMLHLRRCAAQGDWLFLKNLHLVLDWAYVLEKELSAMPPPNQDFRLIITTEPHDLFPTVLLRMSLKMTIEAPPGVKQNLMRSYIMWDEGYLRLKTKTLSQMLFGLAWFHALLQERRNYVPQGWIKFYEFSLADMKAASDVFCMLSHNNMDWVTLRGMLQNCIYGGRLENVRDEQVLLKLISKIFNEELLVSCTKALHEKLHVPTTSEHSEVVQFIRDNVSDVDTPALLCLPDNADRAVKEQHTDRLREELRSFVHSAGVSASAKDVWRSLLVPVLEVWKNSGLKGGSTQALSAGQGNYDPMKVFFISEAGLLREIVESVAAKFADLQCVADGLLMPSAALREEAAELISGRAPSNWLDQMDGPKEIGLWLQLLNRRLTVMTTNAQRAFSPSGGVFDLVDFLRPQTFLIALRQYTARTTKAPLVDMSLVAVPKGGKGSASPASGTPCITIKGESIQVQGSLIDAQATVSPVSSSSPSSMPMPTEVQVWWMYGSDKSGGAHIPLYTNATRSTKILDISVPGGEEKDEQLLLGGVAAFLMSV